VIDVEVSQQSLQEHSSTTQINPTLPDSSEAKRQLLAKYLRGEVKQPTSARTISRLPADALPQLSFAQERLWFLDQLNPDSAVYNVPLAVKLAGPIDSEALERSVNEVVRRHDVLRTTFATIDGRPVPTILREQNVYQQVHDLSDEHEADRETRAHALLTAEAETPFDLARGPLIRATLIKLAGDQHIFLVVMHHIASDGWSLVLFFQELSTIYDAFSRGKASPLEELPVQYADYTAWQRHWLQGETLHAQLAYWKQQLGGQLPVLELPSDRQRPAVQTFNGAREWLALPEQLTESLLALSQREGGTLFITLLAIFKVLLYRYSGEEDVIVGSPIANRPQTETESLIGFFLNNLALRTDLAGDPTFQEVLTRVRKTSLDAYAHQDVPFEKLIDALRPERDLSRTPIFQVYFNLFNFGADIQLPGSDKTVSFVEAWAHSDEELSKFDLTLYAGLQNRELKLAFVYNTDLYDAGTIKQLLSHFKVLTESAVAGPDERISELRMRHENESQSYGNLVQPGNEFSEFRREEIEQSIADRFVRQVEKYPRRVAIKSKNHEWTYAYLRGAVDEIAQSLLSSRGPCKERVALLFEHDAPMVAGMLGVLRAGKTYVPLDPNHPQERLAQIIEHSEATVVLTNNKNFTLAQALTNGICSTSASAPRIINIDDLNEDDAYVDFPVVEPDNLAYILYTSGSTGQPKGVMQNHSNVLHYIRVYTNSLHINVDDRLTLFSSYCFDASVMDIYGALLNGATLYPVDIKEDGLANLAEQLAAEEITIYHSTPTVYRYFINELDEAKRRFEFPSLRLVVLGGEKVIRADVESYQEHFSDRCLFVNGLGPTEATVSLQNFINKQTKLSGDSVPVGFAVDDTEVLLLNRAGKPSEVCGEIAIKSRHVALGYWQNAEATAHAFSANGQGPAVRIYRTGDMGRRLSDGSIKFEGRKDSQIKIRGFRVELGEIESAISKHPAVSEGVVVAHENGHGNQKLTAYVVPAQAAALSTAELREFLRQKLPEYMVPSAFVTLEALPLTASGKLNRRALPSPDHSEPNRTACSTGPQAAQTPLEQTLARIWSNLLEVKTINVNDNFFELGGHSLLAVRLFAQIENRLGKRLPLATLFQAPTIAELAAVIEKDWTSEWTSLVGINPVERAQGASTKPPFFCVHALGGNVLEYYDLARHLGQEQPFYGLQSQGLDESLAPHRSVEDMAAHYVKEIRELQPEGPYFIGGRSLGGMVAFEMARQLRVQGESIALLALLDTYPSGYAKLFRNEATLSAAFRRAARRTRAHVKNLKSLSVNDGVSYVLKKARFAPRKLKSQIWRRVFGAYQRLGRPLPQTFRDVKEFNSLAVRAYAPQVYDGKVTLFWASADLRTSIDLVEGWRALAGGGIAVHEIPGSHLDIIKEPHVQELAEKLGVCLKRANESNR
jgi:amino acid adenylation domain-containing protein